MMQEALFFVLNVACLLFWLVSAFIFVITVFFLLEVLLSMRLRKSAVTVCLDDYVSSKAAIIIPAHNEEEVIRSTLLSIIPQLRVGDEIVVVADNCSDATAEIVKQYPVTLIERNDDKNRGKGYALDFALRHIKGFDVDVVLMFDADCIVGLGARDNLVAHCLSSLKPVQSLYLMESKDENPSLSERVALFAWRIKNKVRPSGLSKMGGPCQLMGTGMAFPVGMLDGVQIATGCIVEDMKLGIDLTLEGDAPLFLQSVCVTSYFPDNEDVQQGQKTRWVHGHLEMICNYAPSLLRASLKNRDRMALLLFFDLIVPPLLLLLLANIVTMILSIPFSLFANTSVYVLVLLSLVSMMAALFFSWFLVGRDVLALNEVVFAGIRKLKSFSLYLSFVSGRLKSWNKTSRK